MGFGEFYSFMWFLCEFCNTVSWRVPQISSHFQLDFCPLSNDSNNEHACHSYHSMGQQEMIFKFSLTDESCSDSEGQISIHHSGVSKTLKNLKLLPESLFECSESLGQWHKVFCRCPREGAKVIKSEEQFFNHGHKRWRMYDLFVANERYKYSLVCIGIIFNIKHTDTKENYSNSLILRDWWLL